MKLYITIIITQSRRAQELCESRSGRPVLSVPNEPYGFCGRKARLNWTELRSCVKVEVAVLCSPSLISLMVSVDVKQNWTQYLRAQELCESRRGRPVLPGPNKPYGFCGRKATLNWTQYLRAQELCEQRGGRAWALIPHPILPPSLISLTVSVDVKHNERRQRNIAQDTLFLLVSFSQTQLQMNVIMWQIILLARTKIYFLFACCTVPFSMYRYEYEINVSSKCHHANTILQINKWTEFPLRDE